MATISFAIGPAYSASGFTRDGVPLLLFLANVEEPYGRTRAAEHISHVDAAQVGEVHQLPSGTVYVSASVQNENRLIERRKERCDCGALYVVVQAQQDGGAGKNGPGVAGRDKRVGPSALLKAESDDDAGVGVSDVRRLAASHPCR